MMMVNGATGIIIVFVALVITLMVILGLLMKDEKAIPRITYLITILLGITVIFIPGAISLSHSELSYIDLVLFYFVGLLYFSIAFLIYML
jgi:hypothetical protein